MAEYWLPDIPVHADDLKAMGAIGLLGRNANLPAPQWRRSENVEDNRQPALLALIKNVLLRRFADPDYRSPVSGNEAVAKRFDGFAPSPLALSGGLNDIEGSMDRDALGYAQAMMAPSHPGLPLTPEDAAALPMPRPRPRGL